MPFVTGMSPCRPNDVRPPSTTSDAPSRRAQFAAVDADLSTSVTLPATVPAKALRSVTVSVAAVADEFVTNP